MNPSTPRKVVLMIYDQAKLLDITGPLQVFSDARDDQQKPAYDVVLVSATGGPVTTDTRLILQSEPIDRAMSGEIDLLLVAGAEQAITAATLNSIVPAVAKYADRPRRLGSICSGTFVLAELGLLDGREATTHWGECNRLQQDYPAIKVRPDAIFVQSGRIWTSAGVSAGIDMALAIVEEDLGHSIALNLARLLVLFLKRPGGQSQFSIELQRQMRDEGGRFDALHSWMLDNLAGDLSVPTLAAQARMSPRNFARVYHRETGDSPARAVELMRVEAARRLLESAPDSIQRVADRVGFGDDERMRRSFLRSHGITPQDYRSRFGRFVGETEAMA